MRKTVVVSPRYNEMQVHLRRDLLTKRLNKVGRPPLFSDLVNPDWWMHVNAADMVGDADTRAMVSHVLKTAAQEGADIIVDACSVEGKTPVAAYRLLKALEGEVIHGSTIYLFAGADRPNLQNLLNTTTPLKGRIFNDVEDFAMSQCARAPEREEELEDA